MQGNVAPAGKPLSSFSSVLWKDKGYTVFFFVFCEQLALLTTHSEGGKPSSTTALQDCSPGTTGRPTFLVSMSWRKPQGG